MGNNQKTEIELPVEWVIKKVLGPTFEVMGDDLAQLYEKGRDRIFSAARKKITDIEDGKRANLRVARDVLWNGAFCDEAIGAEYFGGILAVSRSVDGRSDDAIPFADVVKAMSSKQLKLHYDFYHSLAKSLMERTTQWDVFELPNTEEIFVFKLTNGVDPATLFRLNLISSYSTGVISINRRAYPYCSARPSLFGIMLYAAAHNMLKRWQAYGLIEFGDMEEIQPPLLFATSLEEFTRSAEIHERSME